MSSTFVSSSQLSSISFGLPLLFFPGSQPSNTVLTKEPCHNTCFNHLFCLFLSVSMSSLLVSTLCHFFCALSKLSSTCDAKSTFQMFQSFLCHSSAGSMTHFRTVLYSIRMLWLFVYFQLETEGSTHEIFLLVESFLCQCNATSYFTFASAVLGHHTSKVEELCDWLQFFTVDRNYSQLSALPPWQVQNFGLSRFILMLYFADVCWSASIMHWSPHWLCCVLITFAKEVMFLPVFVCLSVCVCVQDLSLIHIWRCRRIERCRSRWSPYH